MGAGEDVSWLRVQKTPAWFAKLMSSDSQLPVTSELEYNNTNTYTLFVCLKKLEKRQRQKQEQ